jgi:hypothetical protein
VNLPGQGAVALHGFGLALVPSCYTGGQMTDSSFLQAALTGYKYELDRVKAGDPGHRRAAWRLERRFGGTVKERSAHDVDGRACADRRGPKKTVGTSKKAGDAEAAKPKKKRHMSAAGRRAIAEATRKRWAAFTALSRQSRPAPELLS